MHHFNTYTSITATKATPFSNGTQADILLSGITTIDNPAARNLYLDVVLVRETPHTTNSQAPSRTAPPPTRAGQRSVAGLLPATRGSAEPVGQRDSHP